MKLIRNAYFHKTQVKLNFGGVDLTILELWSLTNWILFSYFSFPKPNCMKLIDNTFFHKTQVQLNYCGVYFTIIRNILLNKWKSCLKFLWTISNFSSSRPNVMKLIHNAHYHKILIKFEFWWGPFYCSGAPLQIQKL